MITWRDVPGGYEATVSLRGAVVARMHARATSWSIDLLDGDLRGPASSIGHAKRAAADALAEALSQLHVAVQSLIRTG